MISHRPTPISTTSSTPYPIEEVAVTPLLAPDPPTTTTPTTPQAPTATTTKTFTTPTTALEPPNTAPSTPDPIKRENGDEKGQEVDNVEGKEAVPHPATTSDTTADDVIVEPSEKTVPYIVKAEKIDLVVDTTQAPEVATEITQEKETPPLKSEAAEKEPEPEEEKKSDEKEIDATSVDAGNGTSVASTQVDLLTDNADGNSVTEEQLEPVIKPFREWAEKRQQEEKKKVKQVVLREVVEGREGEGEGLEVKQGGTPSQPGTSQLQAVLKSNGGSKLTKNFATPDCSAKIVAANPESQGASNVISHSKDEYFLNKCTDKSWFVVELCESIKALKVQLANFELYSSSPKEVRVSLGNVWPGRAQDWVEFGTFLYKDERAVQTFKSEQVIQSIDRKSDIGNSSEFLREWWESLLSWKCCPTTALSTTVPSQCLRFSPCRLQTITVN